MTLRLQALIWTFFGLTGLTFLGAILETITYAGFLRQHHFVDLKVLFLPFLALGLYFYLYPLKTNTMRFKQLISINNKVVLPASVSFMLFFTALEYLHFPNYVYSTFHLQYSNIFYGFALSLLTSIYFLPKKTWKKHENHFLFLTPFVLTFIVFLIRLWPDTPFFRMSREDALFENLQFFFFGLASAVALRNTFSAFKKKYWGYLTIFITAFLFLFFVAGEEISWGQRILHIATPAYFQVNNMQQETTMHNINGLQQYQYIFYLIFSGVLMSSWMWVKLLPGKLAKFAKKITPPWYSFSFFLPIFIFYLSVNVFSSPYKEWQEFSELIMAAGLLLVMLQGSYALFKGK